MPICEKFGFTPSLAVVTGSPPVGDWSKADVIRETMRRLELTEAHKPEILMVGDRKFDVLGASVRHRLRGRGVLRLRRPRRAGGERRCGRGPDTGGAGAVHPDPLNGEKKRRRPWGAASFRRFGIQPTVSASRWRGGLRLERGRTPEPVQGRARKARCHAGDVIPLLKETVLSWTPQPWHRRSAPF